MRTPVKLINLPSLPFFSGTDPTPRDEANYEHHMGMERTLGLFQERFFWPKMATDVTEHIRTCKRCTHFKLPHKTVEMKIITASYPLKLIHLDFLMTGTRNDGNKNVSALIVKDHFTRYAAAYVMPKQTAPVVAKVLWENFQ